MTGYQPEEVIGKKPTILQGEETDKETLKNYRSSINSQQIFEGEVVNYDKNKKPFKMHWKVMPIINNENNDSFYLATQEKL